MGDNYVWLYYIIQNKRRYRNTRNCNTIKVGIHAGQLCSLSCGRDERPYITLKRIRCSSCVLQKERRRPRSYPWVSYSKNIRICRNNNTTMAQGRQLQWRLWRWQTPQRRTTLRICVCTVQKHNISEYDTPRWCPIQNI